MSIINNLTNIEMKKEYTKIASIAPEEKIVAMISIGGYWYWNWKYPFRHYKDFRFMVATEKGVYEITYDK